MTEGAEMLRHYSHRAALLSLAVLAFICGTATAARAQLRAASLDRVGDTITCHIANTSYQLTPDKAKIRFKGLSSETQEAFDKVTPYTDLYTNIYTIPVLEHINVEICPGEVNYIAYNADWLLNFYSDTSNRWALYAVIAHEVGHYILAHDRRSAGSNPKVEQEADEYAGEVLAKMGASLEEAQSAYHASEMQPTSLDGTHPPIAQRLDAVERGWRKIRGIQRATERPIETDESSHECLTCIQPGPVELKDSVYRGGLDNKFEFRFKMTTVQFNTTDDVQKAAFKITDKSGTHVWNNKKYYWTKKNKKDRLLLAWWNLTSRYSGWVIVESIEGRWYYKTNAGEWKTIERGKEEKISWDSEGQTIEILLYAPNLSSVWTVDDIQYSFGYSN
jgi:hypothetical protein